MLHSYMSDMSLITVTIFFSLSTNEEVEVIDLILSDKEFYTL